MGLGCSGLSSHLEVTELLPPLLITEYQESVSSVPCALSTQQLELKQGKGYLQGVTLASHGFLATLVFVT